jgi:hypothetical protein
MKQQFPAMFQDAGGAAMMRLVAALKAHSDDIEAAMKEVGLLGGNAFKDMFGDTVSDSLSGFDLTQFLKDPSSETKSIYNMKAFDDNVFQPAFKESSAKWGEELGKGLGTAIRPAADYVSKLMDTARDPITSQLFTFEQLRTLEAYKSGLISLQDVFDVLTGKAANWETALGNQDIVFEQHWVAFSLNKDKDLNRLIPILGITKRHRRKLQATTNHQHRPATIIMGIT